MTRPLAKVEGTRLRAAFAEVDVTPPPGLRLAGIPPAPVATGTHSRLHGRVALFDDGVRRVGIVVLDAVGLDAATVGGWRAVIACHGRLAPEDVLVCCTHTHRAPPTQPLGDVPRDVEYLDHVLEQIASATSEAATALQRVELRVAKTRVPGWGFNRRPIYRGGEVGTNGPAWGDEFEGFEGPADDELQLVVALADGAPIGGLVNYACHSTAVVDETVYSADFPGALVERLASVHGGVFAFLQGACGDVSPRDLSNRDGGQRGPAHAERMGHALADAATAALAGARAVTVPRIRAATEFLEIEQRRPTSEQIQLARWYLEEAHGAVDEREFTHRLTGHDYTFHANHAHLQERFVRDLIGMWEWQRRSGVRTPSDRIEVQVLAVGDVAFVGYPAEMFCELGLRTREVSPFATTMVCELANGNVGYVPATRAFEHGGYETRFRHGSRLVEDAGDRMTRAAWRCLAQLYVAAAAERASAA